MNLAGNLKALKQEIFGQANLVCVTKKRTHEQLNELYQLGERHWGENRVQELEQRVKDFPQADIHWHFIGPLQSNKIKTLLGIPGLEAIHSVGNLKHLDAFDKHASELGKRVVKLYLQVNTSTEEEKEGIPLADFSNSLASVRSFCHSHPNFELAGLMTMATLRTHRPEEEAKRCFTQLHQMAKAVFSYDLKLSMGMSSDYKIALEVGTDWIRIGSKLFD